MNRQTEFLVQVAGPEEGRWSVCKIMSKQMLREAEKARMKNKKQAMKGSKVKELELNWAIDEHDLQHRLDRLQGFLEKGVKVDVVLAGKKKGRQATPEECRVVLKKVRERIRETEGAREVRAQEGEVPGPVMLHLEGRGKGRKDESGKVEVEVVGQGNHEMGSE
ncbi:MAG: hypothetical protein M1823_005732 [Watsoniomyces obsoletus]|nr:MAG: hypothetical protein M1823_005732 [Watsoniomyces obsoletus]